MSNVFKQIGIIVAIAVVALIILGQLLKHKPYDYPDRIIAPKEKYKDVFQPERVTIERVSSNPLSSNASEHLPKGVSKKDVDQSVEIMFKPTTGLADENKKPIRIIQLKSGELWVEKDSSIASVTVTRYEPAIFGLCMKPGLGICADLNHELTIGPMASLSFVEWNIGKLDIFCPMATIDLDGIGAGAQVEIGKLGLFGVNSSINIGIAHVWNVFGKGNGEIKGTVELVF